MASNCIMFETDETMFAPQSNVYFVSSRRPNLDIINDETFKTNLVTQQDAILNELDDLNNIEALENNSHMIEGLASASIAYAARAIEKRIEMQTFYCDCCKFVFNENRKLDDSSIYVIDSKRPCASTFYLCKIADRFLNLHKPKLLSYQVDSDDSETVERDFIVLYYLVFREIDFETVFENSTFKDHEEHKFHLIRCIVKEYIRIKTTQISKQITFSQHDKILRSRLAKWIHFCGQ